MAERGRDDPFAPSAAPLAGEAIRGLVGREDLDRARGTHGGEDILIGISTMRLAFASDGN
jgi:hypothetical protein